MAEAFAVLGVIANIIDLIGVSVKIYDRAKGFSDDVEDIPKAFRGIRNVLPSVSDSLQKTQWQVERGEIDDSSCAALKHSLRGCTEAVIELSELFEKVLPKDGASKVARGWKAVCSLGVDKKVEDLNKAMMQYVGVLTLHHVSQGAKKQEAARKPLFTVRYRKEDSFIGRKDIMIEIAKRFEAKSQRVAITGKGGIGKSRIAIEYCYQYRAETSNAHVFWIHGGSRARFEAAFRDIAATLRIPGFHEPQLNTLNLVSDWLSQESNGSWLMILDNADNSKIWDGSGLGSLETSDPLVNYLPRGEHGSILITSRDTQLGKVLSRVGRPKQPIEVLSFNSDDAISLFRSRISEDDRITEQDALELISALDYLPLAITQAAAYLDLNDMSVREYLKLVESSDLLSRETYDESRDSEIQNSVFKTWKISFDQISEQWPRAGEVLSLMAMFDRQGILIDLLKQKDTKEDELVLVEAISKLKAFSLITEESKGQTYGMHRIVNLSVQWYLRDQGSLTKWQEKAVESLNNLCPNPQYGKWGMIESLIPHVQVAMVHKSKDQSCLLRQARLNHRLGVYYTQQIRPAIAIQYLTGSLAIREGILGPENKSTLTSMAYLAWCLALNKNPEDAELLIRRAVSHSAISYPNPIPNPNRLRCHGLILSTLASILLDRGMYEEADEIATRVIALYTAMKGPEHRCTLRSMYNLGYLRIFQKKYAEGEKLLRTVLNSYIKSHGSEHYKTCFVMHNLAFALSCQGKFEEQEPLLRKVVSFRTKEFGPENIDTLSSVGLLSKALYDLHNYDEAKDILEMCLERCIKVLGPAHDYTIFTQRLMNDIESALAGQTDLQPPELLEDGSTIVMDDEQKVSGTISKIRKLRSKIWRR